MKTVGQPCPPSIKAKSTNASVLRTNCGSIISDCPTLILRFSFERLRSLIESSRRLKKSSSSKHMVKTLDGFVHKKSKLQFYKI